MRLALHIAWRYLFSKKSHSAINIISMISVCGVTLITAALICVLSVYNGFSHLIGSLLSDIQPDVKIVPAVGKTIDNSLEVWNEIESWDDVVLLSPVIEEMALAVYDRQCPVMVKGIPYNYDKLTDFTNTFISGEYTIKDNISGNEHTAIESDYESFTYNDAILGAGIAVKLEAGTNYSRPIELYAPRRTARVNMANPSASFTSQRFNVSAIFYSNQAIYDDNMVYIPLETARKMFDYPTASTAIELRCTDTQEVVDKLRQRLGNEYIVQDRLMQNGESFRWIQIEKWITFLILAFILLIATFNIVGALSMLIVDKQDDIATLRKLGADDQLITRIFTLEGWLISMIGAFTGLVIGVVLCWLQQEYGLLRLGDSGAFIVEAYPVRLHWGDTLLVTLVVTLLGAITAGYPARILRKKFEKQHH